MINPLVGAKVYLSGAIEADQNASTWRNRLTPRLETLGMTIWDPLVKPDWMAQVSGAEQASWKKIIANPPKPMEWCGTPNDIIETKNREIRRVCLKIAGHCDLMIVKIDKKIFTVGTYEELTVAVQRDVPVMVLCDDPIPSMWLVDMLNAYHSPSDHFFQTEDALVQRLTDISTGTYEVNKRAWASIFF